MEVKVIIRYCCGKKILNCCFIVNICCKLLIYVFINILFVVNVKCVK